MTETTNKTTRSGIGRWLKRLMWVGVVVVILIVALCFIVTRSGFVKGVILPKVGASLGADIAVADLQLSPFSQITLRDVKVTPKGAETLFSADSVRLRYNLLSILRGNIVVDELTVTSPTINVVENADGSCNLDFLNKPTTPEPRQPPKPASSQAASVDIKSVSLNNATIRHVKNLEGGGQDSFEISSVNISASNIKNGQAGKLDLSAALAMARAARTNAAESKLAARITGAFTFELAQNLNPSVLRGDTSFTVGSATGDLKELDALVAKLTCDVAPTEVKEVALRFSKANAPLGEVRASGPFDAMKTEGKLKVEVVSLDRRVLNLAGAASGLDFGTTLINSTNEIELTKGGNSISAMGQINISHLQVIKEKQKSPTLDLKCDYGVAVDNTAQTALLKTLNLIGTQNQRLLLRGELTGPMTVALGGTKASASDSTFNLILTNLDLADWKAFAPEAAPQGLVNLNLALRSQQGGTQLALDLESRLAGLAVATDGKSSGRLDARIQARVSRQQDQSLSGQLSLADVNGSYGDYRFNGFGSTVDFDVTTKEDRIEIRKVTGQLREGRNAGGTFELTGNFNPTLKEGKIALQLASINQYGLRTFLEPAFSGKKLESITINSTVNATFAGNDSTLKSDLRLANLVVSDPKKTAPATPLELRLKVDTSVSKQVAQVGQCQLTLTPTERGKNELDLTGQVNFSKADAVTGNLKLAAESLDLTRYYDLFAGESKPAAAASTGATTTTTSAPADPTKEPDAMKLPFANFVTEIAIGRLYLREVDVEKFQAIARLDGGHLVLKPCQFTLNGAPVTATADCDLGVPGYKYDVAFNAQSIPLAPLVNSFQPDRKGQMGGTLTANTQIKGAGTTGASLQKNLTGTFGVVSTNMNLSLKDVRSKFITPIINVVIGLPELIKNPLATLTGWATGTKSGWADSMTAAPIDVILVNGNAGNGHIKLDQAEVSSAAFKANATGDIAIAPILTNSTINFPVTISLSRQLAEQIGQVTADTPTNAVYVALPDFFKMTGTLGQPNPEKDKVVIGKIALKAGGGITKGVGSAVGGAGGSVLNTIGGILGGKPATNAPAGSTTNKPAGLLDRFLKPKTK